jgi:hypothetical protein
MKPGGSRRALALMASLPMLLTVGCQTAPIPSPVVVAPPAIPRLPPEGSGSRQRLRARLRFADGATAMNDLDLGGGVIGGSRTARL